MSKDIFDQYQELLSMEYNNNIMDIDDMETFITSEELVKKEEQQNPRKNTSRNDGIIEESVHFKRYSSKRKHVYTEKEMSDIRKSCNNTIVHDYGKNDMFHYTDEERLECDVLGEISLQLATVVSVYSRIDKYIDAMRIVFSAWEILEKNNYIHTKDEFFKLVSKGKIISNRIILPKLKRQNQYNLDMIIQYISNPELDSSTLMPEVIDPYDSFFNEDQESEEEIMARMLSEKEAESILYYKNNPDEIPEMYIKEIDKKYIKGYDQRNYKTKKLKKKEKHIRNVTVDMLNRIQDNAHYKEYGYSYNITNSLFEPVKEKDDEILDMRFDGSWAKNHQVDLFNIAIDECIMDETSTRSSYMSNRDVETDNIFKDMEDAGLNTLEIKQNIGMTESLDNIKRSKMRKANKSLEKIIVNRIINMNNSNKFKKLISKVDNREEIVV